MGLPVAVRPTVSQHCIDGVPVDLSSAILFYFTEMMSKVAGDGCRRTGRQVNRVVVFSLTTLVFGSLLSFHMSAVDFLRYKLYDSEERNNNNVIHNHLDGQGREVLPDWRLSTDCSVFSRDCAMTTMGRHAYAEYPFRLDTDATYNWETTLPHGWNTSLSTFPTTVNTTVNTTPKASDSIADPAINRCVEDASQKSIDQQLDDILRKLTTTKSGDGLIAFTISDYSYASDMLQDVFEMSREIVLGYEALFLVAMDRETMQLACKHKVPFLAWPQPDRSSSESSGLKLTVANTKFDISHKLVQRNHAFFFFEMDVWFVRSPQTILSHQTSDLIFSGHQDNPNAINIGVYSALANNATREFFQLCIHVLQLSPDSHDQRVMQQVVWWNEQARAGKALRDDGWLRPFEPTLPNITNPVSVTKFTAQQIASSVWPIATEKTLAIHTLCGTPLSPPHGKKTIAKELGGWYGADSYYYSPSNRYLWFDGHVLNGLSTVQSWPGSYHNWDLLKWTIAAHVALARRTNRIWVTPRVVHDYGIHFLWTFLDMQSVEELSVDVRETNFPANSKAWHNASMPFAPVARTALASGGRLFVQPDATVVEESDPSFGVRAWKLDKQHQQEQQNRLDVWFGIHISIPQVVNAQVLLSGLPDVAPVVDDLKRKLRSNQALSVAESEIHTVWKTLRWCGTEIPHDVVVGRANADHSCYGKGSPSPAFQRRS